MPPPRLFLIKQIRPGRTQVNNLRTPIAILLESRTLEAVEGVADPFAAAHDAFVLVVAETALVANAYHCCGPDVGVAYRAFAVAFVAEAADCYAGGFAAHHEIGVVARHCCVEFGRSTRWSSVIAVLGYRSRREIWL